MRYRYYVILVIMWFPNLLEAQDPIFSHYYGNPLYLNPALTGYEAGTSIYGIAKNQWRGIGGYDAAFNTQSVAIASEIADLKSGLGVIMTQNTEGSSQLKWKSIGLSYSFHALRNCNSRFRDGSELSFGFRATYNRMDFDFSRLVFSDQLDPINGIIGPSMVSNAFASELLGEYYDLDVGAIYSGFLINYKVFYRLGFAVNHLVNAGEVGGISLPNEELAPRYTVSLDLYANRGNSPRTPEYSAGSLLRYSQQASAPNSGLRYQVLDAGLVYIHNPLGPSILGLLFHRWAGLDNLGHIFSPKSDRNAPRTNSLGIQLGAEIPLAVQNNSFFRLVGGYNYDYSGLRGVTKGSWEVSFAINFPTLLLIPCRTKCEYRKAPYPVY